MGLLKKLKRRLSNATEADSELYLSSDEECDATDSDAKTLLASTLDDAPDDVKSLPYYHGYLPRKDAADMVTNVGDFLVRRTDTRVIKSAIMLTLRMDNGSENAIDHLIIPKNSKGKWEVGVNDEYDRLEDYFNNYMKSKESVVYEDKRYVLKHPIKRHNWQVTHSRITRLKKIHVGECGEVWKGTLAIDENRSLTCAIRCLTKEKVFSMKSREDFIKEARICRLLQNDNIVKFRAMGIDEDPIMLLLEWCEIGSLLDLLHNKADENFPIQEHIRWCVEAAQGMRYLEKHNIIHRYVAAKNCMVDANCTIKISNFGFSLQQKVYKENENVRILIRWLSPETLSQSIFTSKSDVWSFGILMYEIFSNGAEPYIGIDNKDIVFNIVQKGIKVGIPPNTPPKCSTLMTQCFAHDPNKRPTFLDLKLKLRKELSSCSDYKKGLKFGLSVIKQKRSPKK